MTDDDSRQLLAELQRHFDQTAERLTTTARQQFDVSTEAFESEMRLVAEGVASLGERVSREIGRLDEKVHQGFADTQAMIRFSHAEQRRAQRSSFAPGSTRSRHALITR